MKKTLVCGMLVLTIAMAGCGKADTHKYPSMDMGADDVHALAYVSANTPGDEDNKKEAVFVILDKVWYDNPSHLSVSEIVYRAYDGYMQPEADDYELIHTIMVENGEK